MGRRALRKVDPTLDLTSVLRTLDDLPRPWDAAALFGRVAPLEWEIGSGKGLFLTSAAATMPDTDFVGIEIVPTYARFAAARIARRSLTNVRVVAGDAARALAEILPDASLAAVHVYFPDPWWKKRHRKRRVMRESVVRDVERTLLPGGSLHFWSDVREYFDATLALLAATTRLVGPLDVPPQPAENDLDYRTHFERRMRLAGQPIYRAEFRKPS
jgi:tRNA (guanine-N7-)-methyltransferase